MQKSDAVREAAEQLYSALQASGTDVMLDDRGERPGVMFADCELLGIPHRIVIGDRSLKEGQLEYKHRRDADSRTIPIENAVTFVNDSLSS